MPTLDPNVCSTKDAERLKFVTTLANELAVRTKDEDAIAVLNNILTAVGGTPAAVTTDHFNGTVGTTAVQEPAVAGDGILEVLIHNTSPGGQDILVSFDGGTKFITLTPDANIIWCLQKNATQIDVKASAAGGEYEIVMNRQA